MSQSALAKSREKQQNNVRTTIDSGRVDVSFTSHHLLSVSSSHHHHIFVQIERHIKVHEDFVALKQRKIEADCQGSRDKFTYGLQAIEQKVVSSTEKFEAEISRAVKDKRTLKKAYKVIADLQNFFNSCSSLLSCFTGRGRSPGGVYWGAGEHSRSLTLIALANIFSQSNAINRHFEETIANIDKEHEKLRRLILQKYQI